jgi:hypothetical protein
MISNKTRTPVLGTSIQNSTRHPSQSNLPRKKSKSYPNMIEKIEILARCHWFTPVILATCKGEIGRIAKGQPEQIVHLTHLQNNHSKTDWRCGSSSRMPAVQIRSPEFKKSPINKKRELLSTDDMILHIENCVEPPKLLKLTNSVK